MYKISIPIQNRGVNENNKFEYIDICKRAQVDRVFLTASLGENAELLSQNIAGKETLQKRRT